MKLSDAKPCACCGGPLLRPPIGCWYVMRISTALIDPKRANRVLGLAHMFDGHLGIAEAFHPDADRAIVIAGDKEPELMTEIHVCFECLQAKLGRLPQLLEHAHTKGEREAVSMTPPD